MARFRDIFVALALASAVEALVIYAVAPQYMLADRFSRSITRLTLLNTFIYLSFYQLIHPFFFSPLRDLPEPKGSILLGHGSAPFQKPLGANYLQWFKTIPNGGLLRFRGYQNDTRVAPTSVEALKAVLSDHSYDYEKPTLVRSFLTKILGNGLLMSEGAEHKFQRKHLMQAFQVTHIRSLYAQFWEKASLMTTLIENQIAEQGPVVELNDWATRVTLDIIGAAGLGKDFGALRNPEDELVKKYNKLLEPSKEVGIYFAVNVIFPPWVVRLLPWKLTQEVDEIVKDLYNFSLDLVHDRQSMMKNGKLAEAKDILTLLVQSDDFKDSELADQLLTFIAAGHETTSSTLTWIGYLLASNPEMQTRLRTEIRENLPSLVELPGPTSADIEALPYLNAICNEALRLYPSIPMTIRESIRDTYIPYKNADGVFVDRLVPTGTRVQIIPWAINRSPEIWGDDAEQFLPDRWMGEGKGNTGGQSSNYAQITFLHGPRSCIGQGFAKAELKCLVAAMFGRIEVELADPNKKVYPAGVITTKPNDGMHLKMRVVEGW